MSAHRIAVRYAKSLLDLGIENNELATLVEDVAKVRASLASRDLFLLIKSPIISTGKKKAVFRKIFDPMLGRTLISFFDIMLRKSRENILPEIIESFDEQYKVHKAISTVILKTAVPLEDKTIAKIKEKLANSAITKPNIDLVVEVDPALIGGFQLKFEDKDYDASLAHKLSELRKQFSSS